MGYELFYTMLFKFGKRTRDLLEAFLFSTSLVLYSFE